jgi:hypothetical protein
MRSEGYLRAGIRLLRSRTKRGAFAVVCIDQFDRCVTLTNDEFKSISLRRFVDQMWPPAIVDGRRIRGVA